jgi:hypothetical protein
LEKGKAQNALSREKNSTAAGRTKPVFSREEKLLK